MAKFDFKTKLPFGEMFLVKSSEIEGRIDIDFYRPNLTEIEKKILAKSKKRLKDFALSMGSGATPSTTNPEFYSDKNGIPLLRVQNLTLNSTVELNNLKYITADVHENMLKRSQVTDQDLLVKITGVGRMAVAAVPPKEFSGNVNQHIVVVRTGSREKSLYLANYLNLDVIEKLASRRVTGGTRPALDYPALRSIPIIEDIDFSILENAKKQANQLKQQAKTLLNSINSYLLGELGITLPETDNSLNSRMFTVKMSDVGGGAFDPFTQFNKHYRIEGGKYPNERLDNIAFLQKGQSITSDDIVSGDYPVIAGGQTSPYSHNVCNHKGNVITVSASGAYSGYVWYHDYSIFASDCTVIFSKDENKLITEFLAEVLKVKQQEIYLLQKGAGQPHVYPNDLAKLNIPLPDKPTQQKIIAHIQAIKAQATALQAEAEQLLNQAKAEIEQMILGDGE
jgi:putative type I restriction modification DNA specificity domain protein